MKELLQVVEEEAKGLAIEPDLVAKLARRLQNKPEVMSLLKK